MTLSSLNRTTHKRSEVHYLPSLVVGELQREVELLNEGNKRSALRLWFERPRRPLPVIDSMLAATALRYSALLATRNTGDDERTGVEIVDPWEGSP